MEVLTLNIILLLLGFAPLIYGATLLVDSASSLARKFNVPNIVIGLTIVAFGTSSPELIVNLLSSSAGNTELALGNIVGSNIFNTLVILGICAMIVPLSVKSNTVWIEIPLCLLAAVSLLVLANDALIDGAVFSVLSRIDGLILILFFLIFMGYNVSMMLRGSFSDEVSVKDYKVITAVLLLILGFALLFTGGRMIVIYAVRMAETFGIAERIIALTIVSVGTSLPELATSVIAARKNNLDLAVGNIVGSNIFNIFFILGTSALLTPIPLGGNANFDLLINISASLLLFIFLFTGRGRQLERWEGLLFLAIYLAYLSYLTGVITF
jgi:cation:H+ antiporter